MFSFSNKTIHWPTFISYILVGFLTLSIFIPVPLAKVDAYAYFLGEKKDFLIYFFWPSDIALTLTIFYFTLVNKSPRNIHSFTPIIILAIVNAASIILNWRNLLIPSLSIYYLLLLYKGYVLHGTGLLKTSSFRSFFEKLFLGLATAEALLAIFQFTLQKSIGLKYLGETVLGPYISGIAKIESENLLFMRAYGTMPHPNVLGCLLGIALLLGISGYVSHGTNPTTKPPLARLIQLLILLFGLIVTFSRAAWLATAVGTAIYSLLTLKHTKTSASVLVRTLTPLFVFTIISLLILLPLVQPRTNIVDKAYTERRNYNNAAMTLIASSPIFGVGPGQSLLHMKQHLDKNAKPWEIQPIHNYFLLYTAELGIISLLLLSLYFAYSIKSVLNKHTISDVLYVSLFSIVLILQLFDHYFYTIQPTLLTFWLISSYFFERNTTYDTASPV